MGGSPSAFTSPGLPPQALAMLMGMQNGSGGPMLPTLPKADSNVSPGNLQGPQGPQQTSIAQLLAALGPRLGGMLGGGAPSAFGGLGSIAGTQTPVANSGFLPWFMPQGG
jgi:hypothetical protein